MKSHTADGWTMTNGEGSITIKRPWECPTCLADDFPCSCPYAIPKSTFAKLLAGVSEGVGITIRAENPGDPKAKAIVKTVKSALADGEIAVPDVAVTR